MTFRESERSWLYPAGIILVVALAIGIIGVIFASTDTGQRLLNQDGGGEDAQPVVITATQSFDPPPGSRAEHDDELPLLIDGNPATEWTSESYSNPQFGGLKSGVGTVMVLDANHRLDEVTVTSRSNGWSAEVYVADGPKATLQEWGRPVASQSNIGDETVTFSLDEREGAAVLLWITNLGPANQVAVGEVQVTGH